MSLFRIGQSQAKGARNNDSVVGYAKRSDTVFVFHWNAPAADAPQS
jgi:hypothetical protein